MSAFTEEDLLVKTTYGVVRGSIDGNTHRWLGIPYGKAQRFTSAQPPKPWKGVRDAIEFGDIAPQSPSKLIPIPPGVEISEDCLNLNIWAPPMKHGDKPKPVMFWIHGGAYFIGFSSQATYNGRYLAEKGDVVIVTINYRLGALGWLDFSSIDPQFESNLGMKDILLALEWVKKNIHAFGGNPEDVTLFGESAGAGCVTTLMTIPRAKGLFHKAIAQSSPATSVYKPARASKVAQSYLDLMGIPSEKAAQKLRTLSATELASGTTKLLDYVALTWPGTVAFAPVVDGELIKAYPVETFRKKKQHPVPLIIGTNKDEAALFKMMKSPLMPISESAVKEMFQKVSQDNPKLKLDEKKIVSAYKDFPKQKGAMEISRDAGFRMPSIWVAEAHSQIAPTWMYRFDQAPPLLKLLGIGASHASELPYVFGTLPQKVTRQAIQFRLGGLRTAQQVSKRIQARWLSFVHTSRPDSESKLSWPQYDELTRNTLLIDARDSIEQDPEGDIRQAWGEQIIGYK